MMDYSNNGDPDEAIEIYHQMRGAGVSCNQNSFATVVSSCGTLVMKTLIILLQMLLCVFSSCGDVKNADCVFHLMLERDTISRNSIISAYSQNGLCEESLSIFQKMHLANLKPNSRALSCLVSSCSSVDNLRWGMVIRSLIVKLGLDSIVCVANTLITLYCEDLISWHSMMASSVQNGHHRNAPELPVELCRTSKIRNHVTFASAFSCMSKRNEVTWNALIGRSVENEEPQAALEAYKSMRKDGISVNYITIVSILGSWSALNDLLRVGMSIHAHIVLMGFGQDDYVKNSLLTIGQSMSHLCRSYLLNHGGVIDEGLSYFCFMMSEFGVTQGIQHCVYIIDLLGRSGRLSEAEKNHSNLELGEKTAQQLLELDPSIDAAYVLLSNVCAVSGRWEDVDDLRRKIKLNNIKKKPACSWVKVNKKVNTFGMGAKSHPHADQIYAKLEDLKQIIRETARSLPLHSLINSIDGSVIRIFRNLHVSGDCHSKFKLVSVAVQRTIVLRRSYRFHHFSGGGMDKFYLKCYRH
ncbi:hypothetical protein MKX03_018660 [Papaver bracteatum]|nr:hypothetical protein MKX03_018660 [Papaver bracteatum]